MLPALEHLYDEIWVYGLADFADPLPASPVPRACAAKLIYTGYLRRAVPRLKTTEPRAHRDPYVLVTVGGGDDGTAVIDWVLSRVRTRPGHSATTR